MPPSDSAEQLTKYLTDVHSVEVQALEQMRLAPRMAGAPQLRNAFIEHYAETVRHEQLVRDELSHRGASPSLPKDVAGRVGGWGMVLFARLNPDTPGKLAMHAHSYEHMELAAYELLGRFAARAGDSRVQELAARIGGDERAMADRLAEHWDAAVEASLREKDATADAAQIVKYLRDAHGLEAQAIQLLAAGPRIVGIDSLAAAFADHLEETREHQRLVDARLAELDASPARVQGFAMRLSALNLAGFFGAQPDTPVKLAGFAYAFEALEVGAYELLRRIARHGGDEETAVLAERILAEEQSAAERMAGCWDAAVDDAAGRLVPAPG